MMMIQYLFEVHSRRLQVVKALTYAPTTNPVILSKLYEIVFGILDKVCPYQSLFLILVSFHMI